MEGQSSNCYHYTWIFDFMPYRRVEGCPGGSDGKESFCNAGDLGWSLNPEDPWEKGMASHSNILAWKIPRTEEPGGLQSMGSQTVGHDWKTDTHAENYNLLEERDYALLFFSLFCSLYSTVHYLKKHIQ